MRQELRETTVASDEASLRDLADCAPVMLWVTDADGECTWLNDRWYRFTGQQQAEALGFGWTDAVHPDDKARAKAGFIAANAVRGEFRCEYRLRGADGGYRWMLDTARPRFDAAGAYLGYVGAVLDIDARHATEARLERSESRFRAAVGAIQGVLWTNSAIGEMVGEQPGWSALTGQSEAEYSGFGWSDAVHPDDAAATVVAWQAAVEARRIFAHEHRVRRFDGEWRHFSIRAVPILDAEDNIVEWVGIHTDVTEQHAGEAALRQLNDTLEQRVEAEVAQRLQVENVLRQSQKMDSLGQLTGGIAHDFNNLLTVITSSLSLIARKLPDADPQLRRLVAAGQDAAMRAAGLTGRLLAFARQQPLTPETVDVNGLISGMTVLFDHAIGRTIRVELALADDAWPVLVDRSQLESAVLNLVVNARDAIVEAGNSGGGRGRVTIATRNHVVTEAAAAASGLPAGDFVIVRVSDTGVGMTAEVRARIFEPFFTTKPVGQGTGLGLAQVYGFVRQSGGTVEIVSAPGAGTSVDLYLPRSA